jgi:hypothetical protein
MIYVYHLWHIFLIGEVFIWGFSLTYLPYIMNLLHFMDFTSLYPFVEEISWFPPIYRGTSFESLHIVETSISFLLCTMDFYVERPLKEDLLMWIALFSLMDIFEAWMNALKSK